jgi:truncated hemoglobin YjbI
VRAIVERFYDLMELDAEVSELRASTAASLESARDKLFIFLSGWLGGPPLYTDSYGHPMLRARHLPFAIGEVERDQWIACMKQAMDESRGTRAVSPGLMGEPLQDRGLDEKRLGDGRASPQQRRPGRQALLSARADHTVLSGLVAHGRPLPSTLIEAARPSRCVQALPFQLQTLPSGPTANTDPSPPMPMSIAAPGILVHVLPVQRQTLWSLETTHALPWGSTSMRTPPPGILAHEPLFHRQTP